MHSWELDWDLIYKRKHKKENVNTKRIKGLSVQTGTVGKWTKVMAVNESLISVKETHFPLERFRWKSSATTLGKCSRGLYYPLHQHFLRHTVTEAEKFILRLCRIWTSLCIWWQKSTQSLSSSQQGPAFPKSQICYCVCPWKKKRNLDPSSLFFMYLLRVRHEVIIDFRFSWHHLM